jgi:hypothetical protein
MTLIAAIQKLTKTVVPEFQMRPWLLDNAPETSEEQTIGILINDVSGFTMDLIGSTFDQSCEIAAKLIDAIHSSDLYDVLHLQELSQAKVGYRFGTIIRDGKNNPRGYRMHYAITYSVDASEAASAAA